MVRVGVHLYSERSSCSEGRCSDGLRCGVVGEVVVGKGRVARDREGVRG